MSAILVPMTITGPGAIGMTVGADTIPLAMHVTVLGPPISNVARIIPMSISTPDAIEMRVTANTAAVPMAFDTKIVIVGGGGETYPGPYTVTPTRSTQTLQTRGLVMSADVTVNPIPPNYGLITWDGIKLTVS